MATRSAIVMKTEDGYEGIYCHWDGYPSHNGKILKESYTDANKVKELISLGSISSLAPEVSTKDEHSFQKPKDGVVVAYHRDRGEDLTIYKGKTIKEVVKQIDHEFMYVFDGKNWKFIQAAF